MRVILHDLSEEDFQQFRSFITPDDKILSVHKTPKNCVGCFGCWTKTPGQCVLKDDYQQMGEHLAKATEAIVISECIYGGYSPKIKSVIDRTIPFLMPFFVTKHDETHHTQRYKHIFPLQVYFYGNDLSTEEKETAVSIIDANQRNFYFSKYHVDFADSTNELVQLMQNKGGIA